MNQPTAFIDGWIPYEPWTSDASAPTPNQPPRLFQASDLAGVPVPERRWHVEPLIPAGTVTLLNGDGGTGKTLLALQLAAATVLGTYWVGRPVAKGPCLFVTAEDDCDEVHRRLADIARGLSVRLEDLAGLSLCSLAGMDALLAVPTGKSNVVAATKLFTRVEQWILDTQPALVVLDTLADMFGGEENQRAQARQFIGLLRGLAIRYGTTVLLLAHPSLTGITSGSGSSGSTAWNNSVRSRLYLERVKDDKGVEEDSSVRVLRTVKSNYGSTGGEIRLRWREGTFRVEAPRGMAGDANATHRHAEQVFLNLLAEFDACGRSVGAVPSSNYAPLIFSRHPEAEGIRKRGFEDAMNRLFAQNAIQIVEIGPASKRRSVIALAASQD